MMVSWVPFGVGVSLMMLLEEPSVLLVGMGGGDFCAAGGCDSSSSSSGGVSRVGVDCVLALFTPDRVGVCWVLLVGVAEVVVEAGPDELL